MKYFIYMLISLSLIACGTEKKVDENLTRVATPLVDSIQPIITLNGASTINIIQNQVYSDAGATAKDDRDGDITSQIVVNNPVDTSTIGTYIITYNVKDRANNSATAVQRTVHVVANSQVVVDIVRPIITLNGTSTINVIQNQVYSDAGATAKDDRDGDISSQIVVNNPVDTSIIGTYVITYNVKDRANNSATAVQRTVHVVANSQPVKGQVYEDAEDETTEKWKIGFQDNDSLIISNIYDLEKKSRVINFKSEDTIYNEATFSFNPHNTDKKIIKWNMKWDCKLYMFELKVTTKKGERILAYVSKDSGNGYRTDGSIINALGSDAENGKWHTYIRDLEEDLKRYEPDNEIVSVNNFSVYGNGSIDDIVLYDRRDNLDVSSPVTVSAPGIVLTFDDSLIDDWYAMREIFKSQGVHATFFCNGWAGLSTDAVNKFKVLESDGHEIGFHTVDHLSTYDGKYSDSENKAQSYLDDQILPGINAMKEDNFNPQSFSYPYISGQPKHNELIRKELPHIREFFANVYQIDYAARHSVDDVKKELLRIKNNKDIGVFLAHHIPKEHIDYPYHIKRSDLIEIINEANHLGLKFYTLKEAHNIYLNQ